jgi:hypothetical protein
MGPTMYLYEKAREAHYMTFSTRWQSSRGFRICPAIV